MQVKREALVQLFVALGVAVAAKWSNARILAKAQKIDKLLEQDETQEPEAKEDKDLLKKLKKAVKDGDEIEILGSEDEDAPKPSKADTAEEEAEEEEESEEEEADEEEEEESEDEDEEEEESEDEDEEEEEPAPKKKGGKKAPAKTSKKKSSKKDELVDVKPKKKEAKKEKGPGKIESIVEFLQAGSEAKPLTKDKLLEKMTARFKDGSPDSMRNTINIQVPSRLRVDRGIHVRKNDKGYWIEGDGKKAPPAPKKTEKPTKKAPAKTAKKKAKK